ncbi:GntR family transcriptional regulator [Kribbella turkmenica]|uniref:GntR family transcriptional regulator n=1 Tax=Kribbella turkmenica TaxID=2530375 RepID=A0A4R4X6D8_9ACTN|nr:GntR family transcriptional regulator [Kribbella turkmenica]TDD25829.1 GntR family transcriptional regulator [Kribbella turkmenica]
MPARHKVIARLIQRDIAAGTLTPGQALPTDEELARKYKAPIEELRLAIAHLSNSGLITVDDAGEAAVSDPPTQSHVTSASTSYLKPLPRHDDQFHESASQLGLAATQRVETDQAPASAQIADRLDIKLGQQVLHLRTVRLADAVPVELEDTYYPCDLVGTGPAAADSIPDEFLHRFGWTRVGWQDAITARCPTDAEAAHLELTDPSPIIERTRVRYAKKNDGPPRPVSYTQSVLIGGRNQLVYHLKQADLPISMRG